MRCCIYCGKELKKNEKCDCIKSRARAAASEEKNNSAQTKKEQNHSNRASFKKVYNTNSGKGIISNLKKFFLIFLKDPVYAVYNPGAVDKAESLILTAIQGIAFSLIVFFSHGNMNMNILSILHTLGFKTSGNLTNIGAILICIPLVTLINAALYFMITGMFYFESRYIFKNSSDFWDIAVRFTISTVPITAAAVISIIVSLFSTPAVVILFTGAITFSIMLNYEGLNSIWNFSPSKAICIISSVYLLYFCILYNLFIRVY